MLNARDNLFKVAAACLAEPDPARKQDLTARAALAWAHWTLGLDAGAAGSVCDDPGRPERPVLVPPRQLTQRKLTSPEGRAALIHAVAISSSMPSIWPGTRSSAFASCRPGITATG